MEIAGITEYINRGLPIWPWIGAAALCGAGIGHAIGLRKQIALKGVTAEGVALATTHPLVAQQNATGVAVAATVKEPRPKAKMQKSHDYREYGDDDNGMRPARENEMSVRAMIETQNRFKTMEQKLKTLQSQQEEQQESWERQQQETQKKEAYYQELLAKQSIQITEQTQLLRERETQISKSELILARLEEERGEMQKKLRRFITTTSIGTPPNSLGTPPNPLNTPSNPLNTPNNTPVPTPIGNISVATNITRQNALPEEKTREKTLEKKPEIAPINAIAPITMAAPPSLPSFDTLLQSARWHSEAQVPPSTPGAVDDLTAIPGVGPAIANMLQNMGITTYREIGLWAPEKLKEIDNRLDFQGRIEREKWVEHARRLHEKKYGTPHLAR
jgi:predicted flap endonuclease-1-like 5' DNA nuclease